MHVYTLRSEQFVPEPIERVFPFFARPENLERITPPTVHFSILSPQPVSMRIGALIDYRIRIRGIPQHWRTRIVEYDPPRGFVDEQMRGPYRLWIHRHIFVPTEHGTVLFDEVRYALPFGAIGRLVHAMFVRRELQAIFAYRRAAIAQLFNGKNNQPSVVASGTGKEQERTA
jgi:ligand-binding SRPBCC domain-containing protein